MLFNRKEAWKIICPWSFLAFAGMCEQAGIELPRIAYGFWWSNEEKKIKIYKTWISWQKVRGTPIGHNLPVLLGF